MGGAPAFAPEKEAHLVLNAGPAFSASPYRNLPRKVKVFRGRRLLVTSPTCRGAASNCRSRCGSGRGDPSQVRAVDQVHELAQLFPTRRHQDLPSLGFKLEPLRLRRLSNHSTHTRTDRTSRAPSRAFHHLSGPLSYHASEPVADPSRLGTWIGEKGGSPRTDPKHLSRPRNYEQPTRSIVVHALLLPAVPHRTYIAEQDGLGTPTRHLAPPTHDHQLALAHLDGQRRHPPTKGPRQAGCAHPAHHEPKPALERHIPEPRQANEQNENTQQHQKLSSTALGRPQDQPIAHL